MNPKVSVNILTKNRAGLLKKALLSVANQTYPDYEMVVVNDGSTDDTESVLNEVAATIVNLRIINHASSLGITQSRQEALLASGGEYIAVLDDDDEWIDKDKLAKQVKFLDENRDYVLAGGGIEQISNVEVLISKQIPNSKFQIPKDKQSSSIKNRKQKLRPESDIQIRRTMLFRNNFFTSTVMFRKEAAIKAGGFIKDTIDLAEDYDLWLRLGSFGKMYNFQEVFANYRQPSYLPEKLRIFYSKQLKLIQNHKNSYPFYLFAQAILKFRILL